VSNPLNRGVRLYTVVIAAHRVEPRFEIPVSEHKIYALSRWWAIRDAVYAVAREVGLPPWLPAMREVARHARIVAVQTEQEAMLS
jgi:hypothetical protein